MSSAADELTLLDRVFFRIGNADTDEQLQSALLKFLAPVLLKLSSEQEGVRKKVMELLVHVNKRIKSRPLVQLPVDALLSQYENPEASLFVTNFTVIYLKLGYPRLPMEKQVELMPKVLNSLEGKPQSHQDGILLILMPVIRHLTMPSDSEKRKALFGFDERPQIGKLLAEFMLDMLLLPYSAAVHQEQAQSSSSVPVPAGMSDYSFKRVTAGNVFKSEDLEQIKLGIVKLIGYEIFQFQDIVSHLVVASADTRFTVADAAEMELKKISGPIQDWDAKSLTLPLYSLFLGTPVAGAKSRPGASKVEHHHSPVSTRIRLKILPILCKSRGPALCFPECIQVFFESLYGTNTNPRLKTLAMQFANIIVTRGNLQELNLVSGVLFTGLLKLMKAEEASVKILAYGAIGKMVTRFPQLMGESLALIQTLFEALSKEEYDVRVSIREALLSMAKAFKSRIENDNESSRNRLSILHILLENQVESSEPMARFVAVVFAATVFPTTYAPARYLLLLASGDSKDEISGEALKALYGRNYKMHLDENNGSPAKDSSTESQKQGSSTSDEKLILPPFRDMAQHIAEKATACVQNSSKRHVVGNYILPYSPAVFKEMLNYLRLCLAKSAGVTLKTTEAVHHPSEWTPVIGRYLKSIHETEKGREILEEYLKLIELLLTASPSSVSLMCLLELVGTIDAMALKFVGKLKWLKGFLFSAKEEMREEASLLYGVIIAHGFDDDAFDEPIYDLLSTMKSKCQLEVLHGCLLASASAIGKKIFRLRETCADCSMITNVYQQVISSVVQHLTHQHAMIITAACTAISELGRSSPLPFPEGSPDSWKLDIVKTLLEIMNNVKLSTKVRERAVKACGFLCLGEIFPHTREIMQGFLEMAKKSKDVEVHFTIGEAFVCCVQGLTSPYGRDMWTVLESEFRPMSTNRVLSYRNKNLEWLLEELLSKLAADPHPNSRQATGIWLLSLLKHCPKLEPVQQKLSALQAYFMDLLSENNEIVQDVASKGLGLVYECGDEDRRNGLVTELIDTLTTGRRTVAMVTDDTKLFEDDSLGKAPTGGNLSTYKELCSLASDLNKPDLVYKFMQLANHNTIWNSKKGAAFGFSTIAALAGEQLSQHLPKIIPRLYRYQFDPTPKIQNSMTRIWRALVPESQKTIDLYRKEILADLITNLTAPEWRVRISCCLALVDFLQGGGSRSLHDCVDSLPELWTQIFRVMDDVHEGTRQAAVSAAKVLAKLTVQSCNTIQGKAGGEVVQKVLPVLLNVGICNTVFEVRVVSLQCLSQLVGSAGNLLKPHLPVLIPALLEATGELETRGLSELSVQFGAEQPTQEAIDNLRASVAKSHYTTETVSKCLQYVDASTLNELIPKIIHLMNTRVLLGTRVACAHFIVLLLTHHLHLELQPYTGKLLAVLVNGLNDRSAVIRKNYACTIGQLVKSAKPSSIEKLFTKLKTWYFEKEDESVRSACAHVLYSISQHNQDIINGYSDIVVPLVFFAMHAKKAPDDNIVEVWEEVWQEITPGTECGIRQHMAEICELVQEALKSSSWTVKAQAASSISTVAMRIGTSISSENRNTLIDILVTGLSGRTWNGKENILKALGIICTKCKTELIKDENHALTDSIMDAVLKECHKEDLSYKQEAMKACGDILLAFDIDRFAQVYAIVEEVLSKGCEEEDKEETNKRKELLIELNETAYLTLGKAWPSNPSTQVRYREEVLEKCVSCLENSTRSVQVAIMSALRYYLERLTLLVDTSSLISEEQDTLNRILVKVYEAVSYSLGIAKHTKLRKEALNVLYLLAKKMKDSQLTDELNNLSVIFGRSLKEVSKDHAPEIKSRVVDIKDILKS